MLKKSEKLLKVNKGGGMGTIVKFENRFSPNPSLPSFFLYSSLPW